MANIENRSAKKMMIGTSYADYIYNNASCKKVTLNAGAGNDYIQNYNKETTFIYANGDGNDIIYGFGDTDTLSIVGGSYTTQTSGNNILVKVGSGTITLSGARGKSLHIIKTQSTDGGTSATNKISTTSGGSKGVTLKNWDSFHTFTGTDNNDSIFSDYNYTFKTSNVTIKAGAGNDTIRNYADKTTIDAGSGNDYIYNSGYNVTINGGTGNDTVLLGRNYNLIQYANGDGNDSIKNFASTDTLSITGGTYSSQTSGSDVILTVGSGKITIVGGKGKTLNIKGTKASSTTSKATKTSTTTTSSSTGKKITNSTSYKIVSGTSYSDKIFNSSSGNKVTISTGAGNDTVTNYGDTVKIDTGAGNDSIYSYSYYGTINAGAGNDTVSLYSSGRNNII